MIHRWRHQYGTGPQQENLFHPKSVSTLGRENEETVNIFLAALMFLGAQARSQTAAPIKLIQTYELPAEVKGNFDTSELT